MHPVETMYVARMNPTAMSNSAKMGARPCTGLKRHTNPGLTQRQRLSYFSGV